MLYAMIPLPFLLSAFKWYCKRTFDEKITYYSTQPFSDAETSGDIDSPKARKLDRVAVRFGHPALYKRLITPMVHEKSRHLLKEIYGHRSNADRGLFEAPHRRSTDRAAPNTPYGYSDMFMSEMSTVEIGKQASHDLPAVEFVPEENLDFENFKKRAEFREEFGGDGELYGRPEDLLLRPGTPSTFTTLNNADCLGASGQEAVSSTRNSSKTRLDDVNREEEDEGTSYGTGYQPTPRTDRFESVDISIPATPLEAEDIVNIGRERTQSSGQGLLPAKTSRDGLGYFGAMNDDETSYDQYRRAVE
jgi:calcium permeable stress-gated cation channel